MQADIIEKMCELAVETARLKRIILDLKIAALKRATSIDIPLEKVQMN